MDGRDSKHVPVREEVVGASAYPYAHEVLVEVTCRDADGHLVVHSYPFEPLGDGEVAPVEEVPDRHRSVVAEALDEKDLDPGDLRD